MNAQEETIAAIATGVGEAAIGVVRVSGAAARNVAERLFRTVGGKPGRLPCARVVRYGQVIDPRDGRAVDETLLLWMPAPHSYTAEDVAEFQVHGGPRVVQATLECALAAGARMADPGEFTRRAFLNGRIDLSQAEAVIDLIRSRTDLAAKAALAQVRGRLSDEVRRVRKELIGVRAEVEVTIDYPEHDAEAQTRASVLAVTAALAERVWTLAASARFGQIMRDGVATVIAGRPNVGKSSLLNALLRQDRAIVTEVAGTTRDVLEELANIGEIPFRVVDTAGVRTTEDVVERIGVSRTRQKLVEADLVLLVLDGSRPLQSEDFELLADTGGRPRVTVINKSDLPAAWSDAELERCAGAGSMCVRLSAARGDGMPALEAMMVDLVVGGDVRQAETAFLTTARQATLLAHAHEELEATVAAARQGVTVDLLAVGLQAAYAALGRVIGEEVGEELLDEIFSRFCLGK